MKCTEIVYIRSHIYNQKSENIDFKGLAEVINKFIFNNFHNPPPTNSSKLVMAADVYHVHHEHHGIKEKLYVMKEHVSTLTNMLSVKPIEAVIKFVGRIW
jgi:hypothetical protein